MRRFTESFQPLQVKLRWLLFPLSHQIWSFISVSCLCCLVLNFGIYERRRIKVQINTCREGIWSLHETWYFLVYLPKLQLICCGVQVNGGRYVLNSRVSLRLAVQLSRYQMIRTKCLWVHETAFTRLSHNNKNVKSSPLSCEGLDRRALYISYRGQSCNWWFRVSHISLQYHCSPRCRTVMLDYIHSFHGYNKYPKRNVGD